MSISEKLKSISALVGIITGVTGFILGGVAYWLAAPERALKTFDFTPRLDVRYYGIRNSSRVGQVLKEAATNSNGITHDLLTARRIVLPNEVDLPFEEVGPDTIELFSDMKKYGANFDCNLHVAYFRLHSAYPISNANLIFTYIERSENTKEPISFLIGERKEGIEMSIALGQINDGEGYFIPTALECFNTRFPNFVYSNTIHPRALTYFDQVLGRDGSILFREMLPSPTIDSTYIQIRG